MNDETFGAQIARSLRRLILATVVLYVGLVAMFVYGYSNAAQRDEVERVTVSTNEALCALRSDFEAQVLSSEEFLKDNPEGIPGIPAELIRAGIEQDRRTVEALSGLHCGGG